MITLAGSDEIDFLGGDGGSFFVIMGSVLDATAPPPVVQTFKVLALGTLNGETTGYTPTGELSAMISNISISNGDDSDESYAIVLNDTLAFAATVPVSGSLVYEDGAGWTVYDENGVPLSNAGGGTPSDTVVGPDEFGASPNAGSLTTLSRGDHDHGLPVLADSVVGPDEFGASPTAGVATTASASDHDHGLPEAPDVVAPITSNSGPATVSGLLALSAAKQPVMQPSGIPQPLPPLFGRSFPGTYNTLEPDAYSLCVGFDGNVWTTSFSDTINQVSPLGVLLNTYTLTGSNTNQICSGPDGNLWITDTNGSIWRLTTEGTPTQFVLTGVAGILERICAGQDGNIWANDGTGVWQITPAGDSMRFAGPSGCELTDVIAGPDGKIWVLDAGTSVALRQVNLDGTFGAEIDLSSETSTGGPSFFCVGPDANFWISDSANAQVIKATINGDLSTVALADSNPQGICAGAGGDLWVADSYGVFWKITVLGVATPFDTLSNLDWVISGPDGALWLSGGGGFVSFPFTMITGDIQLTAAALISLLTSPGIGATLPTSDPHVVGSFYTTLGAVMVSAG